MTHALDPHQFSDRNAFSHAFYNSMPPVESANAAIRKHGQLTTALEVFGPLFKKHRVAQYCGINLLHRHWDVNGDEFPEQIRQRKNDENQLNTRPVLMSVPTESVPASWAIGVRGGSNNFFPFEFTTDPFARDFAKELLGKRDFLAEARSALIDHGLAAHFGICVALRQALSDDPDGELMEVSELGRQSIVTEKVLTPAERENSIQTVWVFGSAGEMGCEFTGTRCIGSCKTSPAHCMELIKFNPPSREHNAIEASHESDHRSETSHNSN